MAVGLQQTKVILATAVAMETHRVALTCHTREMRNSALFLGSYRASVSAYHQYIYISIEENESRIMSLAVWAQKGSATRKGRVAEPSPIPTQGFYLLRPGAMMRFGNAECGARREPWGAMAEMVVAEPHCASLTHPQAAFQGLVRFPRILGISEVASNQSA